MRSLMMAAAAISSISITVPASAALIIDNFYHNAGNPDFGFPTVTAYDSGNPNVASQLVASASSSNGTIIGGERDVRVEILDAVMYQGEYSGGQTSVRNLYPFGTPTLDFQVDQGARAAFSVQYDGIDGSPSAGSGLNLNAAAAGSLLRLTSFYNIIVGSAFDYATTDFTIRMTDNSGAAASVTRTFQPYINGAAINLDFGFAAFEAANAGFDISSIKMIELLSTQANYVYGTSYVSLRDFSIQGGAYTPTNAIGGPSEVPEPGMLGLFGLAALGLAARRRKS